MFKQSLAIGILMFAAIVVVAFLLSLLFWLINRKLADVYFRSCKDLGSEEEPTDDDAEGDLDLGDLDAELDQLDAEMGREKK